MKSKPTIRQKDVKAFFIALETGKLREAESFLNNFGCDLLIDKNGYAGIHIATKSGSIKALDLMLRYGAALDAKTGDVQREICEQGVTALMLAARLGRMELAKHLIKMGAKINVLDCNKYNALIHSVTQKHYDIADLLIKNGAEIPKIQESLLFGKAVQHGELEFLRKITNRINLKEHPGIIPVAARFQQVSVMKYLLSKGALVDGFSLNNNALMEAVFKGNCEIVKILLKSGANAELANPGGLTPLMFAAKRNEIEICKILLKAGAKKGVRSVEGKTAFDFAKEYKSDAELLKLVS